MTKRIDGAEKNVFVDTASQVTILKPDKEKLKKQQKVTDDKEVSRSEKGRSKSSQKNYGGSRY